VLTTPPCKKILFRNTHMRDACSADYRWRTLVCALMNLRNFLTSCKPVSFSRMNLLHGVSKYRVLLRKPEGKRLLERPRRRWVDNIRMDLQEVGCGYMDWIGLAQDRDRWRTFVCALMNLRNFLTSCKPVSFSRMTLLHGVSK